MSEHVLITFSQRPRLRLQMSCFFPRPKYIPFTVIEKKLEKSIKEVLPRLYYHFQYLANHSVKGVRKLDVDFG